MTNNIKPMDYVDATALSQIEEWRDKAISRFKAGLVTEQAFETCMRWLSKLEDRCEDYDYIVEYGANPSEGKKYDTMQGRAQAIGRLKARIHQSLRSA